MSTTKARPPVHTLTFPVFEYATPDGLNVVAQDVIKNYMRDLPVEVTTRQAYSKFMASFLPYEVAITGNFNEFARQHPEHITSRLRSLWHGVIPGHVGPITFTEVLR